MAQEERRQSLEVTKLNAAQKHKERKALIANIVNPSIETVETIPDVFAIAIHISEDQPQATVKMVNFDQQNEDDFAGAINNAPDVNLPFN